MMMVAFASTPELDKALAEKTKDSSCRWMKVVIEDEKMVLKATRDATDDRAADVKALQEGAADDEPFFGLVNGTSDNDWVVLAFIPDAAKVKSRMQYSSCLPNLKKLLGTACLGDHRVAEKNEITWDAVADVVRRKKGEVDNSDAMSPAEAAKVEASKAEEREAAERSITGNKGSVQISFPIEADAKAALKSFGAGELQAVLLSNKDEKFTLEWKAEKASLDDIGKKLEKESRFVVYNHEAEGEKKQVFIYFASDTCPVKLRMKYAASKGAAQEAAIEAGCEFVKKLEWSEAADFTEKNLENELKPQQHEEEEEPKLVKPRAPMNRGPRMLI